EKKTTKKVASDVSTNEVGASATPAVLKPVKYFN
ncbi:hypothetical protein A2U01_0089694, partial [Trifolium medium]|nr:hypothetical protein [Trifolium medium]